MSEPIRPGKSEIFKVVTGDPETVVTTVNALLDEYGVMNWNWAVVDNRLLLSALMLAQSAARMMAMGNLQQPPGGGFRPN